MLFLLGFLPPFFLLVSNSLSPSFPESHCHLGACPVTECMGGQHGLTILVCQALYRKRSPPEAGRQKLSNSEMGRAPPTFVFLPICSDSAQHPRCQHACHIAPASFLIHATQPWGASMRPADHMRESASLYTTQEGWWLAHDCLWRTPSGNLTLSHLESCS